MKTMIFTFSLSTHGLAIVEVSFSTNSLVVKSLAMLRRRRRKRFL